MASVTPEQIVEQRAKGWTEFHPEDFCHRCGRPNPIWSVDGKLWEAAVVDSPRGVLEILCPSCFVAAHEQATGTDCAWEIRPCTAFTAKAAP